MSVPGFKRNADTPMLASGYKGLGSEYILLLSRRRSAAVESSALSAHLGCLRWARIPLRRPRSASQPVRRPCARRLAHAAPWASPYARRNCVCSVHVFPRTAHLRPPSITRLPPSHPPHGADCRICRRCIHQIPNRMPPDGCPCHCRPRLRAQSPRPPSYAPSSAASLQVLPERILANTVVMSPLASLS
ncbi:hypothetical protein DFH06DRAFT_1259922 [Mycena polygramma]|nr:hypothetical protein DFH06DRAFT_1259922 [Mycena polygramma]